MQFAAVGFERVNYMWSSGVCETFLLVIEAQCNANSKELMSVTEQTMFEGQVSKQVDALIFEAANHATCYIYMRTLPTSEQHVSSHSSTADLASIGNAIETLKRAVLASQISKHTSTSDGPLIQTVIGSHTALDMHKTAVSVESWKM